MTDKMMGSWEALEENDGLLARGVEFDQAGWMRPNRSPTRRGRPFQDLQDAVAPIQAPFAMQRFAEI